MKNSQNLCFFIEFIVQRLADGLTELDQFPAGSGGIHFSRQFAFHDTRQVLRYLPDRSIEKTQQLGGGQFQFSGQFISRFVLQTQTDQNGLQRDGNGCEVRLTGAHPSLTSCTAEKCVSPIKPMQYRRDTTGNKSITK